MKQYEVTFIVDPVLSGDEIKATAQTYVDMLKNAGATIVHTDEMGLRQLAYPINRRTSGIYYCIEYQVESGSIISQVELAFRRDERIMRFLTARLGKYGIKYNEDKRNGLIGKAKKISKKKDKEDDNRSRSRSNRKSTPAAKRTAPAPAPPPPPAPVATAEEE